MEQARGGKLSAEQEAKRTYAEMKRRWPEFWKAFGFETEQHYLQHYDLTNFIK